MISLGSHTKVYLAAGPIDMRRAIDGLPLYRQEAIFAREGIELSRQTMSGWMLALVGV